MATSGAPVDANGCVASFRKPLDTCDFHYFAAATRRPFSGAWHTVKRPIDALLRPQRGVPLF